MLYTTLLLSLEAHWLPELFFLNKSNKFHAFIEHTVIGIHGKECKLLTDHTILKYNIPILHRECSNIAVSSFAITMIRLYAQSHKLLAW
jgi:hypothetical protein